MDRLFRKNYHRYFRIVSVAAYFFIMSLLLSGCYQEAEPAKHSQHIENVSISQNQPSQPEPKARTSPVMENVRARLKSHSRTFGQRANRYGLGDDVLSSSFYRMIIDNNLFRPLGWTPPRPQDPYRLTGTLIPTDGDTSPKAFLLAIATNTTHIVTLGDTLGKDTTVTAIESKQVTLQTSGQQRTLRLNTALWLNTSPANRSSVRRQTPVRKETLAPTSTTAKPTDTHPRAVLSEWQTPAPKTYRRRTPEKP